MTRREPAVERRTFADRPFRRSWDRCVDQHRLDPGRRPTVPCLTRTEIRERQSMLTFDGDVLREEMSRLRGLVEGAGYNVTIANSEGVIVQHEGHGSTSFSCRSDRLGSVWQEEQSGTSGIGTCLVEKEPVAVFLDEHFFSEFATQACVAVPVFASDESMAGVLNVSTDNPKLDKATHLLALNVAADASRRIYERIFRARHRHDFLIRLSDGGESMRLAVNGDGCIVGADRHARAALLLPESAIGSRSIWAVFERSDRSASIRDLVKGPVTLRNLTRSRSFAAKVTGPMEIGSSFVTSAPRPSVRTSAAAVVRPRTQASPSPLDRCAGGDREMARQIGLIRRMMGAGLPILALGETGVGKDMLARAIHEESSRAAGPFIAFNCAAVPETLIDSELFGYGGGAFTGAKKEGSTGRLVEASGGTLFLDEIGDMPLAQQTRLLRVLESGEVMPLGGGKTRKVDLQIIAATHQDIRGRVASGMFRQDLFYRLAGAVIRIPALRERDDVTDLFRRLVSDVADGAVKTISGEALEAIRAHDWPGNIREMKHVAQRAVRLCTDDVIRPDDLMLEASAVVRHAAVEDLRGASPAVPFHPAPSATSVATAKGAASLAERDAIVQALSKSSGGIEFCAKSLGMSRATLYRKLKAHGLGTNLRS